MTGFSGLAEALRPDLERVGRMMDDVLRSDVDLLERTNASIRSHPGKMLRPMLSIMAARLCTGGKPTEDAFRLATASELVHNATLLHDDVVDGSASRRGRPTVSALLGGRAAVLLGDFWLVRAVGLLLDVRNHMDDCLRLFSKTLSDLAEGEMIQLQKASAGDTTEEDYLRIIYSKTASLFETAVLSSARSQEASPAQYEALKAYAYNLGIAFQIQDDILDYVGDDSLGKPVGHDLLEQKITLPFLGALAGLDEAEAAGLRERVININGSKAERDALVSLVRSRGGVDYARERLELYVGRAIDALGIFPAGDDRERMEGLARFVAERKI